GLRPAATPPNDPSSTDRSTRLPRTRRRTRCPSEASVLDLVGDVLWRALDGLSLRQKYIAADTANIETPGYQAHRVDFESDVLAAVNNAGAAGSGLSPTAPSVQPSLEPTRTDGNNVNLDEETLQSIDTGLRYQLVTQAVNGKLALLRDAIRGE